MGLLRRMRVSGRGVSAVAGGRGKVALGVVALLVVLSACDPWVRSVQRASVAEDGTDGDGSSRASSLSGDGTYVAFESTSSNLVDDDANGFYDVFVTNGASGKTERVSVASDGSEGNGRSYGGALSEDGRYVAFHSGATNLVPDDANGTHMDVFVHDRDTGVTELVSVASDGTQSEGTAWHASLSADGRYVAFNSLASNLVPGDTNLNEDVFVHDRETGVTERVSVSSNGTQAFSGSYSGKLSADGRYVAFHSDASNLVTGDTNDVTDVFVHDRETGVTERVSVSSNGTQGNERSNETSLSSDGTHVAFSSSATNLVTGDTNDVRDVFVHDRETGVTLRASVSSFGTQGNGVSSEPSVSRNGSSVVFSSKATDLEIGDTNEADDIFLRDLRNDRTERVSVAFDGTEADGPSFEPSVSDGGRYVAFHGSAMNLVPRDANGRWDVFVRDLDTPGFDNMYPTLNYDFECTNGSQNGDGICQTDNEDLRVFAEDSLTSVEEGQIADVLERDYTPTVFDVEWDEDPVYDGDTETDIIYTSGPWDGQGGTLGYAYCDDAKGGTDECDQHYVVFDEDDVLTNRVVCHETGHAVGLTHGEDAYPEQNDISRVLGCMVTGATDRDQTLGAHNFDQIKATYPEPQ